MNCVCLAGCTQGADALGFQRKYMGGRTFAAAGMELEGAAAVLSPRDVRGEGSAACCGRAGHAHTDASEPSASSFVGHGGVTDSDLPLWCVRSAWEPGHIPASRPKRDVLLRRSSALTAPARDLSLVPGAGKWPSCYGNPRTGGIMHLQTPHIGRFCAVGLGTMRGPDWTGTRTVLNAARAPGRSSRWNQMLPLYVRR